jgi:hypothetical protein
MATDTQRFVPKVHPASRPVEPEDPLTLHATAVAGDPEVMLQCLVQEYAWMGWDAQEILQLLRDPFHPALHALWCLYGEAGLRDRLTAVLKQTGTLRFEAAVREEPEDVEEEPELIQLGIRPNSSPVLKGESYAAGV